MKNNRKIGLIAVLVLMTAVLTLFISCETDTPDDPETTDEAGSSASLDAEYTVTVVDAFGNPVENGVVVQLYRGEEQIAMLVPNENGTVSKTLEKGEYTVTLAFTGDAAAYHYDTAALSLTSDVTSATVVLTSTVTSEATDIFAYDPVAEESKDQKAYNVDVGGTYVTLADGRNYFLFTPTLAGTYEFSVDNEELVIGYYGAPHFVQRESTGNTESGSVTVSVQASMIGTGEGGTSIYVIGVDVENGEADSCILKIERIGEPEYSVSNEPWVVYTPTATLSEFILGDGVTLENFDVTKPTDEYALVYNEADGYYHLGAADGPLVYMRLGSESDYLDSIKKVLETSGITKYFYNEDGTFEKKESYSECLLSYIENMDEDTGVYPLTKDLEYIIKQRGEYVGWWDSTANGYLFLDEAGNPKMNINSEIAWLFLCCYEA